MTDDDQPQHDRRDEADDTAFARLQAADPARGSAPDLASVLAAVTASTGVVVTEETILVDELAVRRARRAPRWLQVAALVAGIAVIGGGSYALGGARAGTTPVAAPAAAPAMNLTGGGRGAADSAAAPQSAESLAGGAAGADAKIAGWGFGRTVFTAKGLSSDGGNAAAYGFDAASTYSQATAEKAAAALGVSGTAQQQYGTWTVGPNDGTAPSVSVSSDGLTSLSYYDPTRDPWTCIKAGMVPIQPPTPDAANDGAGTDAVAPPGPVTCPTGPGTGPAPSADAAVGQAKDTMTALGVDPSGFEFEPSTDTSGAQVTSVSAYQVVDGQRSGVSWNFTVVSSGIQSVNGSLAPTVPLGDYAVVSPTDAVARLTDPRFGPSYGGIMPMAAAGAASGSATSDVAPAPSDEPTVPATPAAGSPLAWPVQHVTIVSARLGLAQTTLPDGASVLVPTYELADADGTTWTVIAVADTGLDFAG
ncbi:hypothetical protein ACPPVS_01580 [Cellulomonas sp. McL0617]|uniref:hypothetical protein n=1 Tax=Cellulomonas sp. McL0617 TaxID=3415675 RepID=UPI003CEA592E